MKRTTDILAALLPILFCMFAYLFLSCVTIDAKEVKKGTEIDIYYQDKYIESWSKQRLETLVKLADNYNNELLAEKNGKIKVMLQDDPWILIQNKTYKTKAKIVWFSGDLAKGDYKELKIVNIDISLKEHPDEGLVDTIWRVYGEVAKPGCVIFFGLFLLFVFI